MPKARAFSNKTSATARAGHVLAWESAADEIDGNKLVSCNRFDIFVPRDFRPVLAQHCATEWIDLDLPRNRSEPGALKAFFEAADTAEQGSDGEH